MKLSWGMAVLAIAASGCSLGMRTAPSNPSDRTREAAEVCTSSYLYPALDVAGAAVGGINIGISAAAEDKVRIYGAEVDKKVGLGLGITQLALFGIAATYGVIEAGRCNELRHEKNVETEGEAVARAQPPPAPPDAGMPRATAAAGSTDVNATARAAELPEWSAFRRVPLEPPPSAPEKPLPSRFAPP